MLFLELRGRSVFTIVGVDFGATSAFAVVDFEGKVLNVESRKGWGEGNLTLRIAPFRPSLIACDTRPPSYACKRLAAVFGARLAFPRRSLSVISKHLLTRGANCKNAHERDALAAAFKALYKVQNKLKQAHKQFVKRGVVSSEIARLKRQVLSGKRMKDAR
ncbi:MAG: DUF460 domain-containing protein [Candidatus Micrarchaeia archaeon]